MLHELENDNYDKALLPQGVCCSLDDVVPDSPLSHNYSIEVQVRHNVEPVVEPVVLPILLPCEVDFEHVFVQEFALYSLDNIYESALGEFGNNSCLLAYPCYIVFSFGVTLHDVFLDIFFFEYDMSQGLIYCVGGGERLPFSYSSVATLACIESFYFHSLGCSCNSLWVISQFKFCVGSV
jgi:hypothetical protein